MHQKVQQAKKLLLFPVLTILITLLLYPAPVISSMLDKAKKSKLPWQIQADNLSYDSKKKVYYAEGHVSLTSGDKVIKADRISLNSLTHRAHLVGNVYIKVGRDWLKGTEGDFDIKSETGTVKNGTIFFYDQHVYIRSSVLQKTGKDTYHLERGKVTTCDGEHPDWSFKFEEMDVELSGKGKAKKVSFNIDGVPVLYTPYMTFPVKRERKSGFLFPSYSNSDLNGFGITTPFYWAINDHADATLYPNYYFDRGLMMGVEFRYKQSEENLGMFRFDYLSDHKSDSELAAAGYPRIKKERWWWRSKNNFTLPMGVKGRLDVDVASDKYYLREFDIGHVSWNESNFAFKKLLDRGLDNDKSVLARESTLYLTKDWELTHLGFELHYWDNLDRRYDETTLQQLPRLAFNIAKQRIADSPFYYEFDSEFMDYWRREGTKGQRIDLHPRLSLPYKLGKYLNIEPSFGARGTFYFTDTDKTDNLSQSYDDFDARGIVDCRLDITSNLQRIYDIEVGRLHGLKHTFRPEITYEFIPEIDQDDLPAYDKVDRIPRYNRVTYGVSNFFIGKYWLNNGDYTYPEVGRLKIFQSYDFEESPEIFHSAGRKPFSDITFELDLDPCRYFSLSYDTAISPYDADWAGHQLFLRMSSPRGDNVTIDYRQRPDTEDQINVYGSVALSKYFTFSSRQHYSFLKNEFFEQSYSATFSRQCWSANVTYTDEADTQTWTFMVNLIGIGSVGKDTFTKNGGF